MKRIDKLEPGARVKLRFTGNGQEEEATFLEIEGEGDDRRASFVTKGLGVWESYRYKGYWAYGTSAERLSLLEVL